MSVQLDLFAAAAHPGCVTCGAERPDGYARPLFFEPVSRECPGCNRATIAEIMRGPLAAGWAAAWQRHSPRRKRATA
jgi:hypothetical protein